MHCEGFVWLSLRLGYGVQVCLPGKSENYMIIMSDNNDTKNVCVVKRLFQ